MFASFTTLIQKLFDGNVFGFLYVSSYIMYVHTVGVALRVKQFFCNFTNKYQSLSIVKLKTRSECIQYQIIYVFENGFLL